MDYLELVISLLLTIVVYLIFPCIYLGTKGKVPVKQAKKLALINSIICATLFCIIRAIISGGKTVVSSFAPAVLYYFITKSILSNKQSQPEQTDDVQPNTDNSEQPNESVLLHESGSSQDLNDSETEIKENVDQRQTESTDVEEVNLDAQEKPKIEESETQEFTQNLNQKEVTPTVISSQVSDEHHAKPKSKKVIISIICISMVVCLSFGIGLYFLLRSNADPYSYYFSKEFTSLSTEDQLIKILRREGVYDPSTNNVFMAKEDVTESGLFSFQIKYIYRTEHIEISFSTYYKSIESVVFLY